MIKDQKFKPEQMEIFQGDSVEWQLLNDSKSVDSQLYWEKSRSHVIAIGDEQLEQPFESPLLRISNRGVNEPSKTSFRVRFAEPGLFEFSCKIYTWMKGKVTVLPQAKEEEEKLPESQSTLL